jgi:hypothetical protein
MRRASLELARLQAENEMLRGELERCEARTARLFHQNASIDEAIRRERDRLEVESKRVLRFNSAQVIARFDSLLRFLQ